MKQASSMRPARRSRRSSLKADSGGILAILDNAAAVSPVSPPARATTKLSNRKKKPTKQAPPAIAFSPQRCVPRTNRANQEEESQSEEEEESDSISEMTFDLGSTLQSNTSSRRESTTSPLSATSNAEEKEDDVSEDETSDEEEGDDNQDSEVSSLEEEELEEEHATSEAEDFETESDESEGEDEIVVWKGKRTRVVIDDVDDEENDVPAVEYDNDDEYDPEDDETEAEEAEDDDESEDLELDEDDIRVTLKRSTEAIGTSGTPVLEKETGSLSAEGSEIQQSSEKEEEENNDIVVAEIIQDGLSEDENVMEVEAITDDDSEYEGASNNDGNSNASLDSDHNLEEEEGYDGDRSERLPTTDRSGEAVLPLVIDFKDQTTDRVQTSEPTGDGEGVESQQITSPVPDEVVTGLDENFPVRYDDETFESDDEISQILLEAIVRTGEDCPREVPGYREPIQKQATKTIASITGASPVKQGLVSFDSSFVSTEGTVQESQNRDASESAPTNTVAIPCDEASQAKEGSFDVVTNETSVEYAKAASGVATFNGDCFVATEEKENYTETTQDIGSEQLLHIPEGDFSGGGSITEPHDKSTADVPEVYDPAVSLGHTERVQESSDDSSVFSDDEDNVVVVSSLVRGNMFDILDPPSPSRGSKSVGGAELTSAAADNTKLKTMNHRIGRADTESTIQSHPVQSEVAASTERTDKRESSRKDKIAAYARTVNEENPAAVLPEEVAVAIATRGRAVHRSRSEGIVKQGHWTLGSRIGTGSFGVVHVGMNTRNGTLMAVKTIPMKPAIMTDIRREIDLLKSLQHKNIVRYYGAEINGRTLHIFQEWVPGGSISDLLSKFGSFSLPVIQSYVEQTLQGLAYLHTNKILHRDIKGSNILVNDEGIVKLADFGASRKIAHLHSDMMMSMTVRGTPYFMAPEVFEQKYSSKADIWAIGCVLFQMASGTAPWKGLGFNNPFSLCRHLQMTDGPPSLPPKHSLKKGHLFNHFLAVMTRCFDRNPSSRPGVVELLRDSFFLEKDYFSDDDHAECPVLFSPGLDRSMDAGGSPMTSMKAFAMTAPSPERTPYRPRSDSAGPRRSPLMSPPRPKRRETHTTSPLPYCSPAKDTSGWPKWASKIYREKSSLQTATSGMLDSLAFSSDSSGRASEALMQSTLMRSPLQGLQFLSGTEQSLLPESHQQ